MLLIGSSDGRPLIWTHRSRASRVVLTAAHRLALPTAVCVAICGCNHVLNCLVSWALPTPIKRLIVDVFEPHKLLLLRRLKIVGLLLMIRACCKITLQLKLIF